MKPDCSIPAAWLADTVMCMAVYIGAPHPLQLVPWNEDHPAVCVLELVPKDREVLRHFTFKHVYFVGSHQGCGCGFQCGQYPEIDDEDRPLKRASLAQLAALLADQRCNLEVFACWEGDQGADPEHHRELTRNLIDSDDFFFLEKEQSRFIAAPIRDGGSG